MSILGAVTNAAPWLSPTADRLAATMPAPVKAAILLQVGDLYENRERQGGDQNRTYERLLNPYRVTAM